MSALWPHLYFPWSATLVASALMLSGRASGAAAALEWIGRKRPGIGLSRAQKAVLDQLEIRCNQRARPTI